MITDLSATWADPASRHALLVHAPVLLPWLAAVAIAVGLALKAKFRAPAIVAAGLLLAASIAAGLAAGAGETSIERVRAAASPPLTAAENDALTRHENLGEGGWMWPAGAAILCGVSAALRGRGRLPVAVFALGATAGVCGWSALTGHTGGAVVYTHGLGVPARQLGP